MEVPGVVGGNLGALGDLKGTGKMRNLSLTLLDHLLLISCSSLAGRLSGSLMTFPLKNLTMAFPCSETSLPVPHPSILALHELPWPPLPLSPANFCSLFLQQTVCDAVCFLASGPLHMQFFPPCLPFPGISLLILPLFHIRKFHLHELFIPQWDGLVFLGAPHPLA